LTDSAVAQRTSVEADGWLFGQLLRHGMTGPSVGGPHAACCAPDITLADWPAASKKLGLTYVHVNMKGAVVMLEVLKTALGI
jgi:hypothetical protein